MLAGEGLFLDSPRSLGQARVMKRRAVSTGELMQRIAALEERVARLEAKRAPPGDGRATAAPQRPGPRCPGCGLPLKKRRGRCAACGRPLEP